MAFGKMDPTEIIGMTPDELKAQLGEINNLKTQVTELTSRYGKTEDGVTSILSALDALKPKPEEDDDDPEPDPMKPWADRTLGNTIMLQHQAARERFRKDFELWGTEIAKFMTTLSPEQQANPDVWNNAVLIIRGKHADEIEKGGATGKFQFLEPVSAGLRPDPKTGDNLSREERAMVSKLATFGPKGLTADGYKKGKARLESARLARLGSMGSAMQEAS